MERVKPYFVKEAILLMRCVLITICLLIYPHSNIAQSRYVEMSQSMVQAVEEYKDFLKNNGANTNNTCSAYRIDYIDIGSEELVLVSPIIYLSTITNPFPSFYSISESSLVIVYTGVEKHMSNYENDSIDLLQIFCEYTVDDRIMVDDSGNYIVPLISINWKNAFFVITQDKIRSREFDYHNQVFYHLREK